MRAVRIIGLDPGLRRTGWGVVEAEGSRLRHVAHGVATSDGSADLAARLHELHGKLTEIVARFAPDEAAVEQTFVNKDPVATLKLGQARAIALLVPAQAGLVVAEYAPNQVKKTVVGVGHAEKDQIAHMVRVLLPASAHGPDGAAQADAADALAVAICHAHHATAARRLAEATRS